MANKIKGETALSYDGADYSLVLDFNALAEFEDFLEKLYPVADGEEPVSAMQKLQNPSGMSIREMRGLFWAGLKQRHPEITLEDAGRILSANFDKLGEALAASFPDAEEGKPKRA